MDDIQYRSSYSLIIDDNFNPLWILNLPYYDDDNLNSYELESFLIILGEVYFFLFILSIIISYFVSQYMTQAVSQIALKMKQTRLDKRNSKIKIKARSKEVKSLVESYNNMVEMLDKNVKELSKSNKEQLILNDAPKISEYYTKNDKSHFEKVKELLQTLKIPFSINSKLVRGLDYYSRTVFEFTSSSLGAQNAILGGGRYDTLIKDLGGKETPGIGFAAGMERFLIAMKVEEDNNSKIDVYVACILEEGLQKALHLSNELRKIGMRVTSDPLRRSLKAQMRDANKLESKYIIIIGKEELESEVFIVKNLNKGDQEVLTYSELIELFKKVII